MPNTKKVTTRKQLEAILKKAEKKVEIWIAYREGLITALSSNPPGPPPPPPKG